MSEPINPGRCSQCRRDKNRDGEPLAIHWSHQHGAWLCFWCYFK